MRCFVRIQREKPFLLLLDDDCSLEYYKDVVEDHYRSFFDDLTKPPELILLRCIIFKNGDRLLDFRQKRLPRENNSHPVFGAEAPSAPARHGDFLTVEYEEELQRLQKVCTLAINPSLAKCETDKVISSVSLPRLIRVICDPYCDEYTSAVFWTMFRTFSTPSFVAEHLMRRFDEPLSFLQYLDEKAQKEGEPAGAVADPLKRQQHEHVCALTRQRIGTMFQQWITRSPWDFDDTMIAALTPWVTERVGARVLPPALLTALHLIDTRPPWRRRRASISSVPPPAGAPPRVISVTRGASARHLAEQLHYASSVMYNAVLPEELLDGRHESPSERHMCPNLTAMQALSRQIANWAAYSILAATVADDRVAVARKFVFVADELRRLRSWDMVLTVYNGLRHPAVARLGETFGGVRVHCGAILDDLGHLFSRKDGLKAFKAVIEESRRRGDSHIPCVGVYLRDIAAIERQELRLVKSDVKFSRAVRLYNLLEFLLSQQNIRWGIAPDDALLGVWETWRVVPDETLEAMSYLCEPPAV